MVTPLDNLNRYSVILASGSPRRSELLRELGVRFTVRRASGVREDYPASLSPTEVAAYISREKASYYKPQMGSDELIITADTIVAKDGKVLGKPSDRDAALAMLRFLSGATHEVVTGVTCMTAGRIETFSDVSYVTFAELSDEEAAYYVDTYRPYDKAGAYGIQEWIGLACIRRIEGCYFNVMGLPTPRLYSLLRTF